MLFLSSNKVYVNPRSTLIPDETRLNLTEKILRVHAFFVSPYVTSALLRQEKLGEEWEKCWLDFKILLK